MGKKEHLFLSKKTGEELRVRDHPKDNNQIQVFYNGIWYSKPRSIIGKTITVKPLEIKPTNSKGKRSQYPENDIAFRSNDKTSRVSVNVQKRAYDNIRRVYSGNKIYLRNITDGTIEKYIVRSPQMTIEATRLSGPYYGTVGKVGMKFDDTSCDGFEVLTTERGLGQCVLGRREKETFTFKHSNGIKIKYKVEAIK